jgi:hypothetical protein
MDVECTAWGRHCGEFFRCLCEAWAFEIRRLWSPEMCWQDRAATQAESHPRLLLQKTYGEPNWVLKAPFFSFQTAYDMEQEQLPYNASVISMSSYLRPPEAMWKY